MRLAPRGPVPASPVIAFWRGPRDRFVELPPHRRLPHLVVVHEHEDTDEAAGTLEPAAHLTVGWGRLDLVGASRRMAGRRRPGCLWCNLGVTGWVWWAIAVGGLLLIALRVLLESGHEQQQAASSCRQFGR
jgi:hypothetical protein